MISAIFIPAGPVDHPTFTYIHREKFELEHLYELLNCDTLDSVMLGKGQVMYVDDLGRSKKLPYNGIASVLYHRLRGGDMIVGNALVMGYDEEGETVSVSKDTLILVARLAATIVEGS